MSAVNNKKENITYLVENKIYVNLTNKCPCNCTFCIRHNGDGVYGSDSLWLDHDPSAEEAVNDLKKYDLSSYDEIIFCGYGEPTEALTVMLECCKYIRSVCGTKIRLNTNGLSDLINKKQTAPLLKGLVDTVSISLNAPTEAEYNAVTRPKFENAFEAMQKFASDCLEYVENVMMTVVDVIGEEQIKRSQELAQKLGVKLRVREYEG